MLAKRATPAPAAVASSPKKAKSPKDKAAAIYPGSSQMVIEAITKLAEKKGSSLIAIKKVIADTHKVDTKKNGIYIKNALRKLVETGKLIQAKGTGASGSYKLAVAPKPVKKAAGEKKPKVVKAKKVASASYIKTAAKKPAASKKTVSPKKAVAPKPKKVAAVPAAKKGRSSKPKGEKTAVAPKAPKMKLPKTLKPKVAPKPKVVKKVAPKKQ